MVNELIGVGSHSYKGLLYDAKQGVTVSQIQIYNAFCAMIERGQTPPMSMLSFVASEMSQVLNEKQKPGKMFNKSGKKLPTNSPHYWQLVDMTRKAANFNGDIHAAFEHVSNILGGKPSPSQIRDHYYKQDERINRIRTVSELLTEKEAIMAKSLKEWSDEEQSRQCEITDILNKIYADPHALY